MSNGINIAEQCHVINALGPIDVGGVAKVSDYFSLRNHAHASIIVITGVVGNAPTITLYEATTAGPGAETAIAFAYYLESTAAGDTLATRTAATNAGISMGAANGTTLVIEIDASVLTDTYDYLAIKTSAAAACLIGAVAILSGSRYTGDPAKEAISAIT